MWKDTLVRLGSALVGLIFFFIVIFLNPIVLEVAAGLISIVMIYEVVHAFGFKRLANFISCLCATGMLLALVFGGHTAFVVAFALATVILAFFTLCRNAQFKFSDLACTLFMMTYIISGMRCIPLVRGDNTAGLLLMFMLFICAWISDTGAYFSGKLFGKHKLIEAISPKKTIEGAIGGIVTTAIGGVVLGLIAQFGFQLQVNYLLLALTGAIGSVFGQIGDLLASWLKRQYGIKDFGNIMPGHGGAMDRFDSVLLTAPLVYCLVYYLPQIGLYLIR